MKKSGLKYLMLIAMALFMASASAPAVQREKGERSLDCNNKDNWFSDNRLVSHCEMREQQLGAVGGVISVDGNKNGGVSIKGWDRGEVLVRARVQTGARTDEEARDLAGQIRIDTAGGQIKSEGPALSSERNWAVSYEVFVPRQSDLSLTTHNGGIGVSDVRGNIEFRALNGGVSLKRLGGNVRGHTTNGGLSVVLSGDRWDGEGLDVNTTNGGVHLQIPDNYSAHLETGTTNGSLTLGFPVTVQGRITKQISMDIGSGGTTVRVMTTNGGVSVDRKGRDQ